MRHFDVAVIGAGSSGAVVARRLSELAGCEVLLVEAGPDYADPQALPTDLRDGTRNSMSAHDWGYRHKPTLLAREFPLPRGRVVGGSSAVNTCIALRGQPEDYDEWAARGLSDWRFEACLPAFKRLERDLDFANAPYHGDAGPLPVRRHPPAEWVPWQAAFVEAALELGFPACSDSNAPGTSGAGPHAMNKLDGRRISVAEAYLTADVRARPNLTLFASTRVRRIRLEGTTVAGLELERNGETMSVATSRVVLCAGALNSPAVLLRSGIGPRDQVEALGVELRARNDGVNARLLDHPGTAIFLVPRSPSAAQLTHPLIQTVLRYASRASRHRADMLLQPGSRVTLPGSDLPAFSLMCCVGKPRGHGRLRWTSARSDALPLVESGLLEHASDRAVAVEAMQLAAELMQTKPLAELALHAWPSERLLRNRHKSDGWIRSACDSAYHPCGTLPMGADDDRESATDARGTLRGVQGITVADASVMPTIPSSNIHLPTLMVAERMAEFLRAELGERGRS
jgi:choline dehydrogenase